MGKDQLWDKLIESGIATEEELKLVTCINGYTVETLNDVLFARTGERSWDEEEEEHECA
jgi:hypothetical protein